MHKSIRSFSKLLASCELVPASSSQSRHLATIHNNHQNKLQQKSTTDRLKLVDYLDQAKMKEASGQKAPLFDHVTQKELKFYDPPYLAREAPFPRYEMLNINLKSYDFTSLDQFLRLVVKLCQSLDVDLVESYAMPARSFKIKTLQPFSNNLDKEYELSAYHRVVRIKDLKSTFAPILFESIQLNLPQGVQMSVSVPTFEEDEFRYVPDIELREMRQRLEDLEAARGKPTEAEIKSAKAASAGIAAPQPKK
jgi:large subunit ribosomal protein L48